VVTATGRFILAVIRDITEDKPQVDLAELARAPAAADDARRGRELLSQVVEGLFRVGLSLQAATELPHEAAVAWSPAGRSVSSASSTGNSPPPGAIVSHLSDT